MLQKFKVALRRWKRKITPTVLMIALFIGYMGCIQVQLVRTKYQQKMILETINSNIQYQDVKNVQAHAVAIEQKINTYISTNNPTIDMSVLEYYGKAYLLASNGDKSYLFYETIAENMRESYSLGFKDGIGKSNHNNNTF